LKMFTRFFPALLGFPELLVAIRFHGIDDDLNPAVFANAGDLLLDGVAFA